MQIDWFTFAAQIFNFLILVWLLRKILYQPILTAIADREQDISNRIEAAATREMTANRMIENVKKEESQMARLRESQLAAMASDIEEQRQQLLVETSEEISRIKSKWQAALKREQAAFMGEFRERIAREVQGIIRHLLNELADESLEKRIVEKFGEHLASIDLDHSVNEQPPAIVIRTAFELTNEAKSELRSNVVSRFGSSEIEFETDETLICGVELIAGHRKYLWNIDSELDQLEEGVLRMLKTRTDTPVTV